MPSRTAVSSMAVTAIAGLVAIVFFAYSRDVVRSLQIAADSLAPKVPYLESPYTNVMRSGDAVCSAHHAEVKRSSTVDWMREAERLNKEKPNKVNGNDVMSKVRIWKDDQSGAVGHDRILCVATNQDSNVDRLALVYEKWAHRCDKVLLFTTVADIGRSVPKDIVVEIHPLGGDDVKNMWQRLRTMVTYLQKWPGMNSIDHVVIFGDDTYVFVKNLKKMLREAGVAEMDRLGVPLLLGHRMVAATNDVFIGNAIYIMNKMVVKILGSLFEAGYCDPLMTDASDDLPLGQCVSKVGVYAMDIYDALGEDRTSPFNAGQIADVANNPAANGWYPTYRSRAVLQGRAVYSMYPVMFHYTDLGEMDRIEAKFKDQQ